MLGRLGLDMRNDFFPLRVVKARPRLPRSVVEFPSLQRFQSHEDVVLWVVIWKCWDKSWTC